MTTRVYIQKQVIPFKNKLLVFTLNERFCVINERGIVTNSIIAWIGITIICYLIAVYSFFGINASMHRQGALLKQLTDAKIQVELNVQQKQAGFARNNQNILESMEKISEIRYITSNDVTVSRLEVIGRVNQ